MKRKYFFAALLSSLFFIAPSHAQITKATLQASGLTCTMCSNAINKSLKSLDFVDKVTANIKNSSFDTVLSPAPRWALTG